MQPAHLAEHVGEDGVLGGPDAPEHQVGRGGPGAERADGQGPQVGHQEGQVEQQQQQLLRESMTRGVDVQCNNSETTLHPTVHIPCYHHN